MNQQSKAFMAHIVATYPKAPVDIRKYSNKPDKKYLSVVNHLVSLPLSDFKALISDPFWNSYPLNSWGAWPQPTDPNYVNKKGFYGLISLAVKNLVYIKEDYRKILVSSSTGVFHIATIDKCLAADKLKAAKRGLSSPDSRIRKRAAALSSVKDIAARLPLEKDPTVREKIIKRIGYLNCIEEAVKPINKRWYRYDPLRNAPFSKSDAEDYEVGRSTSQDDEAMLTKIVYHTSKEDSLFYIDILDKVGKTVGGGIRDIYASKITGEFDK